MACSGKSVLIVDDSEFDLIPLEALLGDACGVEVDQATGGQMAIDMFKDDRSKASSYKLIFMDKNMPDVDGLAATKAILAANNGSPLKIVGMTSFETDGAI